MIISICLFYSVYQNFIVSLDKLRAKKSRLRPIDELYSIVLMLLRNGSAMGVCICISIAYKNQLITADEYDFLEQNFNRHKPNWFSSFYYNKNYNKNGTFWWFLTEDGENERIKFLNYLIKKYK